MSPPDRNEHNDRLDRQRNLRARSRRGRIGRTWWSERWTSVLESNGLGDRLQRGRTLARSGSVHKLEIVPGEVRGEVTGSRGESHDVRIGLDTFPARRWTEVLEALAGRALFAARLLAGEMPRPIEEAFAEAGLSLFPSSAAELTVECDCEDAAIPCPHAAAVIYLMAERLDEDPFQIFVLRGRTRRQILTALRRHQARHAEERPAPTAGDAPPLSTNAPGRTDGEHPMTPPTDPTLEILESFADPATDLQPLDPRIMAPPIQEAVLRRLGAPPGAGGESPALEALRRAYRLTSQWALRLASRDTENGKG